jgi:hypothetical protein
MNYWYQDAAICRSSELTIVFQCRYAGRFESARFFLCFEAGYMEKSLIYALLSARP